MVFELTVSVARISSKQVFRKFDYEEACHGAVCLEVSPADTEVAAWHLAVPLDERLAVFPMEHVPYTSLGSTHINQVLRSILGKAVVHDCPAATDPARRLSLQLVEAHDAALAAACRTGLRWEVLSSALAVEEPDWILCIQTALNDPANAVMLMHEMQIIKHMSRVCMSERNAAGEVILESVRSRLLAEGFHGTDSPAFHALLRFVIEQGAGGEHALVQPLVDFHQLLVNPRVRRLRESHFRVVLNVPSPPARLYLLKAAYGALRTLCVMVGSITLALDTWRGLQASAWRSAKRAQVLITAFTRGTKRLVSGSMYVVATGNCISSISIWAACSWPRKATAEPSRSCTRSLADSMLACVPLWSLLRWRTWLSQSFCLAQKKYNRVRRRRRRQT